MFPFFALIESTIRDHRWLWSDVDITSQLPVPQNVHDRYLIEGDTLFEFTRGQPQFIWSVLSALPADYDIDPTQLPEESVPYADGNAQLWTGSPRPQYSDALFEIVCWDSSATLLIGVDNFRILEAFGTAYPGSVDLNVQNRSRG